MKDRYRTDPDGEKDYDGEEYTDYEEYCIQEEDEYYRMINESYNI